MQKTITVIGSKGCGRCDAIKSQLDKADVEYDYVMINDLPEDVKTDYIFKAQQKDVNSMPIIIKNEEVVKINEVIND